MKRLTVFLSIVFLAALHGNAWAPPSGGEGVGLPIRNLQDLIDVKKPLAPADNQALVWDSTNSEWIATDQNAGGGTGDMTKAVYDANNDSAVDDTAIAATISRDSELLAHTSQSAIHASELFYVADTIWTVTGTYTGGDVTDIQADDTNYYTVDEVSGVPGYDIRAEFSGVSMINRIALISQYNGGAGHDVEVELYNWISAGWDVISDFTDEAEIVGKTYAVIDDTNYVSGAGTVQVRLYHSDSGVITHDISIDWLSVDYAWGGGGGGVQVTQHTLDGALHTDVNAMTEDSGDGIVWNGSAWADTDVATQVELEAHAGSASVHHAKTTSLPLSSITSVGNLDTDSTDDLVTSDIGSSVQAWDTDLDALAGDGTDFGTLTDGRICTYDSAGTEIDCVNTIADYETALENVVDLQDLQGAVTDTQVPDDITIDALSLDSGTATADWVIKSDGGGGVYFAEDQAGEGGTGAAVAFKTVDAPNGTDPVADAADDTLTITDGTGITTTGTAASDSLEIAFSGSFSDVSGSISDAQVPDDITIDLAATASALAADPSNCAAGSAAGGVTADGTAEDCFDVLTPAEGDAAYQPLEATLTDIADGTIAEDLVNTANPWAENEIASTVIVESEVTGLETTLEGVIDLEDLQGAVTVGQLPAAATTDTELADAVSAHADLGSIHVPTDCTSGQIAAWNDTTNQWICDDAGAGGGDNVSVDGGAVVDPDFTSDGDIDFVNASNTITADIKQNAILEPQLNVSSSPVIHDILTYNSGGTNFFWETPDELGIVEDSDIGTSVQGYDATLADIADGTIVEALTFSGNIVNTANPWSVNEGGTGGNSFTTGGVLYGNGTNTFGNLGVMSDSSFIVGDGSGAPTLETGATVRTSLGLGTANSPQFTGINVGNASDTTITRTAAGSIAVEGNTIYRAGGTDVPVTDGGTGASTAAAARANLEAHAPMDAVTIAGSAVTPATYPLGKQQVAITITDVHCITDTGTVTIRLDEGSATSFSTGTGIDGASTITCDSNGAEDDGSLSNGSIDANDWLAATITAKASSPTMVNITWFFTVN